MDPDHTSDPQTDRLASVRRMKIRVLIADDHRLIAEGIKRSLEDAADFEVVAEASTGSQILPLVRRTSPDLVLLDLRMPGADGLTCLEQIRSDHPDVKVVILSASTDQARDPDCAEARARAPT